MNIYARACDYILFRGTFCPKVAERMHITWFVLDLIFFREASGGSFCTFWGLLAKWFSGGLWRIVLSHSGACSPNGSNVREKEREREREILARWRLDARSALDIFVAFC